MEKFVPVPHPFWYWTEVAVLVEKTVEQVRPVERPLFATAILMVAATPGPPFGAPGTGTPFASVAAPRYSMSPVVETAPETTCAMAASILGAVPVSRL